MEKIIAILFLFISSVSFGQEWLLGTEKRDVINQYKCECQVTMVRDTMITFTCTESGFQQRAFTFHGDSCTSAWWATDIRSKNNLMERYIGLDFNMHSYIKTINNHKAEVAEITNNRYTITIITYYTSNIVFITSTFR